MKSSVLFGQSDGQNLIRAVLALQNAEKFSFVLFMYDRFL